MENKVTAKDDNMKAIISSTEKKARKIAKAGDGIAQYNFRCSEDFLSKIKSVSKINGTTTSKLIITAVEEYFANHNY